MYKVLVIKPYYVSLEETSEAIGSLHLKHPDAHVSLLANLFPFDYLKAVKKIDVQEKILFGPHTDKLTMVKLLRLVFVLRRRRFDKAFLLIGRPYYENYRKGKLLVHFSGAKEKTLYYVATGEEGICDPFGINSCKAKLVKTIFLNTEILFNAIWETFKLLFITALFIIFFVVPMKIKKAIAK